MNRPDVSAERILDELHRGVRTTAELMDATGMTRNAVSCAIRRAQRDGCRIVNVRGVGGHRGGLYHLAHDPRRPRPRRCLMPGCETMLSASNATLYCREHLADVAYYVYLERLNEVLDELLGAEQEQLEMVG